MTRVKMDRMLVVDLEETCWEGDPPPGQQPEIIEIGIAELLLIGAPRLGRTASYLVKPTRSEVSPFCQSLTGISAEEAKRGRPLKEVIATVRKNFGGAGTMWAAWGRDDLTLHRDCEAIGLDPLTMGGFTDLGSVWSIMSGFGRPEGLRSAMRRVGLEFEGSPHRAGDDAINTARFAAHLSSALRLGLEDLPQPGPSGA